MNEPSLAWLDPTKKQFGLLGLKIAPKEVNQLKDSNTVVVTTGILPESDILFYVLGFLFKDML